MSTGTRPPRDCLAAEGRFAGTRPAVEADIVEAEGYHPGLPITGPRQERSEYAIDAEEQAAGRAREDRERASLEDFIARVEARLAARQAIEAAVAAAGWGLTWRQGSECGSVYFWLDNPESGARYSLRVSDHFAPEGAGWDGSLRCRHEPPDVNIVIRPGEVGAYTFDLAELSARLCPLPATSETDAAP